MYRPTDFAVDVLLSIVILAGAIALPTLAYYALTI